jgi:hypothetical protein
MIVEIYGDLKSRISNYEAYISSEISVGNECSSYIEKLEFF